MRELLAYQEDSAGGIMTNEFITIPVDLTAAGTLEHLRQIDPASEGIHYLYITDAEDRLLGVISLWRLILAQPETPISDFMVTPVISVQVTDSKEDVAATLAKYNLLAVPVIDVEGRILGIVTVDDAIESVIPATWMRRLPKVFS